MDDNFRQIVDSSYFGQTTLHPIAIALTLLLGLAVIVVPRRLAIVPFLILACVISPAQRVVVLGLNFNLMRILVLFGWTRLFARQEWRGLCWLPADWFMVLYAVAAVTIYSVQQGTAEAIIYRVGGMYDAVGMYFFFRSIIRSWDEFNVVAAAMSVIAVPIAACFLIERATQHNMFAIFGGVAEYTWVRNGRLRCQGAYAHAIIAGCFWVSAMPFMASRLWAGWKPRALAIVGLGCSLVIVSCCSSSTPVSGLLLAVLAACMFWMRHWMNWVCVATVLLLFALHLVMKQPVWHLLARIDFMSGSTGWHRYALIDEAINHFGEWALLGTRSTAHWSGDLSDVTNQYVLEGVRGGFISMMLFVGVIWSSYRAAGALWRRVGPHVDRLAGAWALGVGLFVHTMTFFAVSYFGLQIDMLWYLNLALIGSLLAARAPASRAALDSVRARRSISPARISEAAA